MMSDGREQRVRVTTVSASWVNQQAGQPIAISNRLQTKAADNLLAFLANPDLMLTVHLGPALVAAIEAVR